MVTGTVLTKENQHYINASYDEIRGIYSDYRSIVRPYIAFLELFDGEFPVEILNEIRAVFQHLARCYYNEGVKDEVITQDDIGKTFKRQRDIFTGLYWIVLSIPAYPSLMSIRCLCRRIAMLTFHHWIMGSF